MSNEKTPVAYLHQVVCGDGEPDQALSFEPDNFPLSGVLGYRSLSHEPLFRAEPSNELERLRAALWQCFTDAGGDTDGKTDAAGISTDDLISTTTDCVKDLRLGYDEMLDESSEADRLRARVAELETVEAAARVYYEHYMQDEADDGGEQWCGHDQHERAKAVRDSLHDLETFTVKELRL